MAVHFENGRGWVEQRQALKMMADKMRAVMNEDNDGQ